MSALQRLDGELLGTRKVRREGQSEGQSRRRSDFTGKEMWATRGGSPIVYVALCPA